MKYATKFYNSAFLILLPEQRLAVARIRNAAYIFCLFILLLTIISIYSLNSPTDFTRHTSWIPPESMYINQDDILCPKSSILENSCKIPWIFPIEPDVKMWISHYGPISCTKKMPNLAHLSEENVLTIQKDLDASWSLHGMPFK
jgi:hypothetical protein